MARDNETNTLELHIKVNGQNLSAISEKCNLGTLRIPSDPSWPKIPSRRSSNNTDDIIEPCVVTLTGTPRKGRSIVQTVACRHLESRFKNEKKYEATTHIAKKLPGCFDPRFRRQISRQKVEKPDEFCNTKNDKPTTSERDSEIPQQSEKYENKSRKITSESMDTYIPPCHDVLASVEKSTKRTDCQTASDNEQSSFEALSKDYPSTTQHAPILRDDVASRFSQEDKQENNRPLLLMVDEKKIHALSINTLNIEAASSSAQSLQCYSVQIPVVAYHDIPLQISSIPMQMKKDKVKKIPSMRAEKNDVHGVQGKTIGNIYGTRSSTWTCSFRESRNKTYPLDNASRCHAKSSDDIYISEKASDFQEISKQCDDSKGSRLSRDESVANEITPAKDGYGNFGLFIASAIDKSDADNGRSYSNLNIIKPRKQKLAYRAKEERLADIDKSAAADNPSRNIITGEKMLEKNLASCEIYGKDVDKSNKEKEYGNVKRKTVPRNLSRKAKSFFRKKSRLTITDSAYTLILPGSRGVKVKYKASKQDRAKSFRLLTETNLQHAGNSFEKSSSIPLETRQLLNKSYWEYYLKHTKIKAEGDRDGDHLPESQTLRQCSVLSCMINTALQDSTATTADADADGRSSSNPAANVTSNARESVHQVPGLSSVSANKIKRREMRRRASKRLLGLRAIALLCITMYVAVIFLPIMHDYLIAEDDERATYIDITFRDIAASFGEALDGIVDVLTTRLFRPVRLDRKQ